MIAATDQTNLTPADADAIDVEFAANGDGRAFERLYRRHVDRVHSRACWLLGRDDVEDVIQEVFVRAWDKLATFRGQSAFGTWFHRLATNVILRSREKLRTEAHRHSGSQAELDRATTGSATPGLRVDIETAVGRLPEGARRVFVLFDMEGYTHEEIAKLLGISVGTSRSQLHRARMALRHYFASKGTEK